MTAIEAGPIEAMIAEVKGLRSRISETELLVQFLRDRTEVLNNEVRHRDELLIQRDRTIAALTSNAE